MDDGLQKFLTEDLLDTPQVAKGETPVELSTQASSAIQFLSTMVKSFDEAREIFTPSGNTPEDKINSLLRSKDGRFAAEFLAHQVFLPAMQGGLSGKSFLHWVLQAYQPQYAGVRAYVNFVQDYVVVDEARGSLLEACTNPKGSLANLKRDLIREYPLIGAVTHLIGESVENKESSFSFASKNDPVTGWYTEVMKTAGEVHQNIKLSFDRLRSKANTKDGEALQLIDAWEMDTLVPLYEAVVN